jgi:hypothetical protein
MPLFKRKPRPPNPLKPPSVGLPPGEEVERSERATLLQGKARIKGALYLTNKRLLFEGEKGEARWMVVPFEEAKSAGLFPFPGTPMGIPSSLQQCLCVVTTKGEQVWWDFNEQAEREWLPLVQEKLANSDQDERD